MNRNNLRPFILGIAVIGLSTIVACSQPPAPVPPGPPGPPGPVVVVEDPAPASEPLPTQVPVAAEPHLISIEPTTALQGRRVSMTISGYNFEKHGTVVNVNKGGVSVEHIFVSDDLRTVLLDVIVDKTAAVGVRNFSVTTPAGTSNAMEFSVHFNETQP